MSEKELQEEYALYCFRQLGVDPDDFIDMEHLSFEEWKARRADDGRKETAQVK